MRPLYNRLQLKEKLAVGAGGSSTGGVGGGFLHGHPVM